MMVPVLLLAALSGCTDDATFGGPPGTTDTSSTPDTDSDSDTGTSAETDDRVDHYDLPALSGQPDVVLVTIDTFRASAMTPQNTPNLSARFETGLWLTEHQASSNWTSPTMTSILAGRDPLEVGYFPTRHSVVPDDLVLLAETLGGQGYETFACTTNGVLGDAELIRDYDHVGGQSEDALASDHIAHCLDVEYSRILARAGPVLVHTHFIDPHDAYRPPQALLEEVMIDLYGEVLEPLTLWGKTYELDTDRGAYAELELRWPEYDDDERERLVAYLTALYLAEVRFLDQELPALFEGLEQVGVSMADSVLIVASDHGEQLFERGHLTHARTLLSEETGTLAFIAGPGFTPAAYRGLTTHKDLVPLLLTALGLDTSHTSGLTALDGEPRIVGAFQCAQPTEISPLHPGQQNSAISSEGLRLIEHPDGSQELFDRRADPAEQVDVFGDWSPDTGMLADMLAVVATVAEQAASGGDVCVE